MIQTPLIMNEYVYSSIILFIIIYLISLTNLFLVLINFNTKNILYLSSLKDVVNSNPFKVLFILILLNIAGVPPTSMFFIKISMLSLIFLKNCTIIFILSFIIIILGMVFYLQLIRFSISKKLNNYYIYSNYYSLIMYPIAVMISFFTLLNIVMPSILLDISVFIELFLIK